MMKQRICNKHNLRFAGFLLAALLACSAAFPGLTVHAVEEITADSLVSDASLNEESSALSAEEIPVTADDLYTSDVFLQGGSGRGIGLAAEEEAMGEAGDASADTFLTPGEVDASADTSLIPGEGDVLMQDPYRGASWTNVTMKTGDAGVALLKEFEGCRLTAYKAVSTETYYTIGYGHYGPDVTAGMTITQAEAEALLRKDLASFESQLLSGFVNKYQVPLNQNQFDALISFVYNLGMSQFNDSTLRRYILEGGHSDDDIRYAFGMWVYAGGVKLEGLIRRRAAEAELYVTPMPPTRPSVEEASLSLTGKIGMQFYLSLPDSYAEDDGIYAVLSGGDGTQRIALSDAPQADGLYKLTYTSILRSVRQPVTLRLYGGDDAVIPLANATSADGLSYTYTLSGFAADADRAGETRLAVLADRLLRYSTAADAFFDGTLTEGDDAAMAEIGPADLLPYKASISGSTPGLRFWGGTLLLTEDTAVRCYFTRDPGHKLDEYTFTVEGQDVTPVYKEGMVYLEVRNIPAAELDRLFTFTVKDKAGNIQTIRYGAYSYAYSALTGGTARGPIRTLMKNLYLLSTAAAEYFS